MKPASCASQSDTENGLAAVISRHTVFGGMEAHYCELLAAVAMFKSFAPGEVIFCEGDPANRFYLIIEGEVALESNSELGPVTLQKIGAHDVLGWSWLFPPYYWNFSARATQPTKAVFFYGTWLRENCDRDHHFGYEMMRRFVPVIIQRLQAARKQLLLMERGTADSTRPDGG